MDRHSMGRRGDATEVRSVSEILADARDMQGSHAPRLLNAAAGWLRNRSAPRAGERPDPVARRLVVH